MARKIDIDEWRKSQERERSEEAKDARFEKYENLEFKRPSPWANVGNGLGSKIRVGVLTGAFLGLIFAVWTEQSLFNGLASGALLGAVWMFFRTVMARK